MSGRVPRRVDGKHLYGKPSPIAELPCPGGLLPVQRVDDTFLGSPDDVAVVSFARHLDPTGAGNGHSDLRQGGAGAFDRLVEQHHAMLVRLALRFVAVWNNKRTQVAHQDR